MKGLFLGPEDMALTQTISRLGAALPLSNVAQYSNDALTFWKLPEECEEELRPTVERSRASAEWYLHEKYLSDRSRRQRSVRRAYYALKPLVPYWLRHGARSLTVRMGSRPSFPAWPCEPSLIELWREWLESSLVKLGRTDIWHVGFWPDGKDCCVVLTHDVEGPRGMERMEAMADAEEKLGFRSAWNLPLDQYPIDWRRVERLRARGFEFGAHGLRHDGRLFRSLQDFNALAPKLEGLAREHKMRGFRAPSTLRQLEWLATLEFDFDSTLADTDPYEPQPGGTCSIFPFFLNRMVELPYTLPQDHTLLNLLRRDPLPVWTAKARWIASHGGMILTLVHPDYCGVPPGLLKYVDLLKQLNDLESAWRALPSAVAAWWRRRATLRLSVGSGGPAVSGDSDGAIVRPVSDEPMMKQRLSWQGF